MYTFQLVFVGVGNVTIPSEIEAQFREKLYPKIIKKLQKAGYEPGNYWISLSTKMWELNPDEFRAVHPYAVFERRQISVIGTIFREHYPDNGSPSGNFVLVITGHMSVYWEVSSRSSDEEIKKLIVDGNLTQLLLSPICKFKILDLNMQPLLYIQEPSPQSSQSILDKQFNFPYEIIGEDYPDVIFNIKFSHRVMQKHLEKLDAVLGAFVRKQQHKCGDEDEGYIHYIGETELSSEDRYTAQIHIDFGRCEPEMIWYVLNELSENIVHITKVIVY